MLKNSFWASKMIFSNYSKSYKETNLKFSPQILIEDATYAQSINFKLRKMLKNPIFQKIKKLHNKTYATFTLVCLVSWFKISCLWLLWLQVSVFSKELFEICDISKTIKATNQTLLALCKTAVLNFK